MCCEFYLLYETSDFCMKKYNILQYYGDWYATLLQYLGISHETFCNIRNCNQYRIFERTKISKRTNKDNVLNKV